MVYDKTVNFSDTASSSLITDVTYLSPIGFRLAIDKVRYPNVQFSVQTASIPEITVNAAAYATPQRTIEIAGDKIEYAPLVCSFLIDEQLQNYTEIHDWLLGLVIEADEPNIDKTRDITLQVLNSHNNVTKEIQFTDAYPTSLSTLDFDAKNTDVEYLVGEVSFNYSYFKLV